MATIIFPYGGWLFLTGMVDELKGRRPGMMTLIALAVCVAYGYSSVVMFGLHGQVFFWELATLIDVMLLGHWIEMRSVMGASGALEELVMLMPSEAHRLDDSGEAQDVSVTELKEGDRVLVKPGERVPADGAVVEGRTTVNESMLTAESKLVENRPRSGRSLLVLGLIGGVVDADRLTSEEASTLSCLLADRPGLLDLHDDPAVAEDGYVAG